MNFRTAILAMVWVLGTLSTTSVAHARECNIGQTVFMDTVYGMGAGTLVGGLWMIANMDNTKDKDILPNLATAALVGGGVGAIIGVVEVSLCASSGPAAKAGFQLPAPTFMAFRSVQGREEIAPGLMFRYRFD